MRHLVFRDLHLNREALATALLPPALNHNRNALQVIEATHRLNRKQSEATRQVLANRLSLIQGPPSTGKTLVAKAIACVVEHQEGATLLTKFSG